MAATSETLVEGIDRPWLEAQARADPVADAWAIWDFDHEAVRIRFVSLLRDGRTVGYLLVWYGAGTPRVHWVSTDLADGMLALGLPLPPVTAIVPERVAAAVSGRLGSTDTYPVDLLVCEGRTLTPLDPRVRRLRYSDAATLEEMVTRNPDVEMGGGAYASLDIERLPVWGPSRRTVWSRWRGLRCSCRRSGSSPASSHGPGVPGRGLGREVTAAATAETLAAGARAVLYVRGDNQVAQTIHR